MKNCLLGGYWQTIFHKVAELYLHHAISDFEVLFTNIICQIEPTDADPLRLVHVLHGGSGASLRDRCNICHKSTTARALRRISGIGQKGHPASRGVPLAAARFLIGMGTGGFLYRRFHLRAQTAVRHPERNTLRFWSREERPIIFQPLGNERGCGKRFSSFFSK